MWSKTTTLTYMWKHRCCPPKWDKLQQNVKKKPLENAWSHKCKSMNWLQVEFHYYSSRRCVCVCVCVHVCEYAHACVSMYIHSCECICTLVRVCACATCVCVCRIPSAFHSQDSLKITFPSKCNCKGLDALMVQDSTSLFYQDICTDHEML